METTYQSIRPTKDAILSILKQQPCTIREIANHCSSSSYEIVKYLSEMSRLGLIMVSYVNGQVIVSGNGPVNN